MLQRLSSFLVKHGATTLAEYLLKFSPVITPEMFGAKGDGRLEDGSLNPNPTDDSDAIQKAINFAWRKGCAKIAFDSSKSYYIAKRLYILATEGGPSEPRKHVQRRMWVIDGQGAEFIGRTNINDTSNVFMETGALQADGSIVSVIDHQGLAEEQYLAAGVMLTNFNLLSFHKGFRLKDHVFGCTLINISSTDVPQLLQLDRCFYLTLRNIMAHGKYIEGLHRYHIKDNNNIMPIQSVHTGVCDVGWKIEAATEAVTLDNCGIESFKTHGVWLAGAAYNIKFNSCYFESSQGYGVIATYTRNISVDNCWIYGGLTMFGGFDDNTNVRISPNNMIGGGSTWWKSNEGSNYNLSDIHLPTEILAGGSKLQLADAKQASTVQQTFTVYSPTIGLDAVIGKAAQTSRFHAQKVNGSLSTGFTAQPIVGSVVTREDVDTGDSKVVWSTGITYTDTQLVYVALKVDDTLGSWSWIGFVCGDTAKPLVAQEGKDITVHNENGYLVIRSPKLSGRSLGIYGGEIRLVG